MLDNPQSWYFAQPCNETRQSASKHAVLVHIDQDSLHPNVCPRPLIITLAGNVNEQDARLTDMRCRDVVERGVVGKIDMYQENRPLMMEDAGEVFPNCRSYYFLPREVDSGSSVLKYVPK